MPLFRTRTGQQAATFGRTVQNPDGTWANTYAHHPREPLYGHARFRTYYEAAKALEEERTRQRQMEELEPQAPPSNLPRGAVVKGNWGDIGVMRQREAQKLGGFKAGSTVKASAKL